MWPMKESLLEVMKKKQSTTNAVKQKRGQNEGWHPEVVKKENNQPMWQNGNVCILHGVASLPVATKGHSGNNKSNSGN